MSGMKDSFITEVLRCQEALSWLKYKGAQKVIIESYCLLLVQAVNRLQDCHSYTGLIVDDC